LTNPAATLPAFETAVPIRQAFTNAARSIVTYGAATFPIGYAGSAIELALADFADSADARVAAAVRICRAEISSRIARSGPAHPVFASRSRTALRIGHTSRSNGQTP